MDLYSVLACPICKSSVQRQDDFLACPQCRCRYPIVGGVPVLLPGGAIPHTSYQHELMVRSMYDPWVHRVVLQSLPASAVVLDMGAGNQALNLPNVIRMDVTLTPYVDVVGDAHALPFLSGTFDFLFSLAVTEHLRQPFQAAQETYRALRNGGYVYGDCNFVFAYHGYPHHYFNASEQGLEQVFADFEKLRTGVAPYQMPSVGLNMVLTSYLKQMSPSDDSEVAAFRLLLREVLDQPLAAYDSTFTEEGALNVAAGVYFFGRKSLPEASNVVPEPVQAVWERELSLQSRIPRLFDLGAVPNVMLWAKGEGREKFSSIADYFRRLVPFRKSSAMDDTGQEQFDAVPVVAPVFTSIPDRRPPSSLRNESTLRQRLATLAVEKERLESRLVDQDSFIRHLTEHIDEKTDYIKHLELLLKQSLPQRVARRLARARSSFRDR